MSVSYTAELVNGRIYYYKNQAFEYGQPVAVDAETAEYLGNVEDLYSVKGGGNIAQKKFKIVTFADPAAAAKVVKDTETKKVEADEAKKKAGLVGTLAVESTKTDSIKADSSKADAVDKA